MPQVVLFDTNILFSGLGWRGSPYRCVELARRGAVDGITCAELIQELAEKLHDKRGMSAALVAEIIADLSTFLRIVPIATVPQIIRADPDDDVVLACAVAGNADFIVTGDRRHLLPLKSYQGIVIITAAEFLALVTHSA